MKEVSMRIVQWVLMILGWWSGGLLLSSRVVNCMMPPSTAGAVIVPPICPKLSYKCWLASFISLIYGGAWHLVLGTKQPFVSVDYVVSVAVGAVLGSAVARILCPK
jgi:hypothetical protein